MTFIKTYGVCIPQYVIADNLLDPNGSENNHSIAYVDEDIITLAYSACCKLDTKIDAILFSTTTPVFEDRYHASYLADLLGLPQGITALDMGATDRSGTDALILADTLIRSGKHNNVLVVAANVSFPAIGREVKTPFGQGAVGMILSKDNGMARVSHTASYSAAMAEEFTYKGEKVQYDGRFARTVGFKNNMEKVLAGLKSSDIDSLIVNTTYLKVIFSAIKKAGFDLEKQVAPDKLVPEYGYLGSAHGLLRLVHAIENFHGTSVLVDHNNGLNVITVDVEKKAASLLGDFSNRTAVNSYQDYLTLRRQGKHEGRGYERIEMFTSEMIQEREKAQLLYLKGFECKGCGTVYYMKSAHCNNCKGTEFSEKQLSKTGMVYSLTSEHYFPSSFPPTNMIVIDLDGGGRITVQQTDDMYQNENSKISIGNKVELVFRKMMENDSKPNYFWKCVKYDGTD